MKQIEDMIIKLRGEMSTRISDSDIVDILEVLQGANVEIDRLHSELEDMTEDRNTWRSNSLDWNGEEDEDDSF